MTSLLQLMGLDLTVPDHTTLIRPCVSLSLSNALVRHKTAEPDEPIHFLINSTGLKISRAGQWFAYKHGRKSLRECRELHLAMDADTSEIIAEVLSIRTAVPSDSLQICLNILTYLSPSSQTMEVTIVVKLVDPFAITIWVSPLFFHHAHGSYQKTFMVHWIRLTSMATQSLIMAE